MTVVINGTTGIDTGTGSLIAADSTTPTYLDLFEDTDNGSNYVRLIAPTSVASNKTITLPDATGTMVVGSAAVSAVGQIPFSTDGSSYTPTAKIVSGSAVTCAGQTSIDFTGIPSWVKRITVMFNGVSTSGTSSFLIRIGSGSIATANYSSVASSYANALGTSTAGFILTQANVAGSVYNGHAVITNISGNIWIASSILLPSGGQSGQSSGGTSATAISGTLDQIRITTVNGTDTFDTTPSAGTINIIYE